MGQIIQLDKAVKQSRTLKFKRLAELAELRRTQLRERTKLLLKVKKVRESVEAVELEMRELRKELYKKESIH